jgi:hypothetical protein
MTLPDTRRGSLKDRRMLVCIVGWLHQAEHVANTSLQYVSPFRRIAG